MPWRKVLRRQQLEAENAVVRAQLAANGQSADAVIENAALRAQVQDLTMKMEAMSYRLHQLTRQVFGRSSEGHHPDQQQLDEIMRQILVETTLTPVTRPPLPPPAYSSSQLRPAKPLPRLRTRRTTGPVTSHQTSGQAPGPHGIARLPAHHRPPHGGPGIRAAWPGWYAQWHCSNIIAFHRNFLGFLGEEPPKAPTWCPLQSIVLPQRPLVCSRRQNHRTEAWWR